LLINQNKILHLLHERAQLKSDFFCRGLIELRCLSKDKIDLASYSCNKGDKVEERNKRERGKEVKR